MSDDITVVLYKRGTPGLNRAPGDPVDYAAYCEIIRLRNKLKECIHGNRECDITDEACHRCLDI